MALGLNTMCGFGMVKKESKEGLLIERIMMCITQVSSTTVMICMTLISRFVRTMSVRMMWILVMMLRMRLRMVTKWMR